MCIKICFLTCADSIHSYRWVKFFAEKNHEIHWIAFNKLEFDSIQGVCFYEVVQSSKMMIDFYNTTKQVRRLLRKIRPDILHVHYLGIYGLVGALSCDSTPFVATAWGSDILFAGKSFIKKPFIRYILNKADVITCDADHMKREISKMGIREEKIRIIYFGIDTNVFKPIAKDNNLRSRLGILNSLAIVSLRSLFPVYDIETLIRSIPFVLKEYSEAKFVLIGTGPQKKMLTNLCRLLGVGDNVSFLGFIANHELPTYLSSMDIYVSTSLSDAGIASSTAEAMACGLPVVITDSGENRKWIRDGEDGFIVPLKNPEVLANKIVTLLRNVEIREIYGRKSRGIIHEKNNYYKEMEKMEMIYKNLLS